MRRLIHSLLPGKAAPGKTTRGKGAASPKRVSAKGKTRKTRRQTQRAVVLRAWTIRFGAPAAMLAAVVGGVAWGWQSGWIAERASASVAALHAASAGAGLSVQEVLVEGRERTPKPDVLAALGGVSRGSSILAVDTAAARATLEAMPWVKRAVVERNLPGEIYVRLEERRPLAIWQQRGRLQVIDTEGLPIDAAEPGRHTHLLLVVGEDAPDDAARLIAVLRSEPELAERVNAAVRLGGRRWNVRLDDRVDVQLPEEEMAAAWQQLARLEERQSLLQRNVSVIDMRMPDRMVVRMSPDAETEIETETVLGAGQST